jgi:hypothetical protein
MEPKEEIEKEQKELERLLQLREQTEVAIAKAKRRLAAWMEILDDTETGALVPDLDLGGLTDACRTAMRASRKEWLTTTEIMSALKELGFPIHEYKAPMASITTTVNRLAENGEVVPSPRSQPGATEYKWVGPQWGAASSLANKLDDDARDKARLRDEAKRIAAIADAEKRRKK